MKKIILFILLTSGLYGQAPIPADIEDVYVGVIVVNAVDTFELRDSFIALHTLYDTNAALLLDLRPLLQGGGGGTDDQTLTLGTKAGVLQPITIENGNTVNIPVDDLDNDPVNEIEMPTGCNDGQLAIYDAVGLEWDCVDFPVGGGGGGSDGVVTAFNRTGTSYTVTRSLLPNLTFSVADNDNSQTNERQVLTKDGYSIELSLNGGSVTDSDNQTLYIEDGLLKITGGNGVAYPDGGGGGGTSPWAGTDEIVPVSTNANVTINRTLKLSSLSDITINGISGASGETLIASGKGTLSWGNVPWANISGKPTIPTNNNELTNGAGYGVGNITQITAGAGLSGGGTSGNVTVNVDIDELSSGNPSGTDEFIFSDNGTEKKISFTTLQGAFGSTDDQDLTWNGTDLGIEDGNSIDLSALKDNTDDQTLGLVSNQLSIESGNSVNLEPYLDNTDNQVVDHLDVDGTNLEISLSNDASTVSTSVAALIQPHTAFAGGWFGSVTHSSGAAARIPINGGRQFQELFCKTM